MLFDSHTHVFPDDVCKQRESYLNDKNFSILYTSPKSRLVNADELSLYMEESGTSRAAVLSFPWLISDNVKRHNDYSFNQIEKYPEMSFFGSIDFTKEIGKQIAGLKEAGFSGIGEIAFYHEGLTGKNSEILDEIMDQASSHNMIINLHMNEPLGHAYPGKYDSSFEKIVSIIEKYPDLKIVLAHMGGGLLFFEMMPEVRKILKNVYYDISAAPYLYETGIYKTALQITGSGKLLFGTDYPLLKAERYLKIIQSEEMKKEDIDNILHKNAEKLFSR